MIVSPSLEIFGRSKATISECVDVTENEWKEVLKKAELDADARQKQEDSS